MRWCFAFWSAAVRCRFLSAGQTARKVIPELTDVPGQKPKRHSTGALQNLRSFDGRFMGSLHDFEIAHWGHEPHRIPLTRPSGTLSPIGERDGVKGARFMERASNPEDGSAMGP